MIYLNTGFSQAQLVFELQDDRCILVAGLTIVYSCLPSPTNSHHFFEI